MQDGPSFFLSPLFPSSLLREHQLTHVCFLLMSSPSIHSLYECEDPPHSASAIPSLICFSWSAYAIGLPSLRTKPRSFSASNSLTVASSPPSSQNTAACTGSSILPAASASARIAAPLNVSSVSMTKSLVTVPLLPVYSSRQNVDL